MDNSETLATFSAQDTGRRQAKHKKHNTAQKTYQKKPMNPGAHDG